MSFGKLYGYEGNPRTTGLLAIAKENGLDVELVDTNPGKGVSSDYLKINRLGRIPTFVGADGFILSELIAIAVYCMLSLDTLSNQGASDICKRMSHIINQLSLAEITTVERFKL